MSRDRQHIAPFLLPPWLTATAVSLATFRKGITPWLRPLVPLMRAPVARTFVQSLPIPPAHFESLRIVGDYFKDMVQIVFDRREVAGAELRVDSS